MTSLPDHWELHECKDYPGRIYYYNSFTKESTWVHPLADPPPRVYLEHIVVKHTNSVYPYDRRLAPVTRSQQDAQWKAEKIREDLVAHPESFTEIASDESDLPGHHGSTIGWVDSGDLDPEFERIAWGLPLGQPSEVFHTKVGYHILLRRG
jgi:NIMA-interacting peptidyl-prolyl cis-trans isomerase 1